MVGAKNFLNFFLHAQLTETRDVSLILATIVLANLNSLNEIAFKNSCNIRIVKNCRSSNAHHQVRTTFSSLGSLISNFKMPA